MFYCDPWNPVPLQARPGLLDDPLQSPQQWNNLGCADQVSVPPVYIQQSREGQFGGRILIRDMRGGAGSGGSGDAEYNLRVIAQQLFGERLGWQMWREFTHQEFAWNRWGVNHGGRGIDRGYALWVQFPNPQTWVSEEELAWNNVDPLDADSLAFFMLNRKAQTLFLGANLPHYRNKYPEDIMPPSPNSLSAWLHDRLPVDPDFDPLKFNADKGYPVWAIEFNPLDPGPWGRWQGPDMLSTLVLPSYSHLGPLYLRPAWS